MIAALNHTFMKLIVGIGNPGAEYESTRHNIGFMVIDKLARELGTATINWDHSTKHKGLFAKVGDVLLVKPLTYVNNSGISVKSIVDFYTLAPADVWVIHDDMDLPLGKIRIRTGGASAGHHGVDSIMQHLKTDKFVRFRLGIGRSKESSGRNENKNLHHRSVIHFVLSRFTWHEGGAFKHLVKHGMEAVKIALLDGIDKAMNRFN